MVALHRFTVAGWGGVRLPARTAQSPSLQNTAAAPPSGSPAVAGLHRNQWFSQAQSFRSVECPPPVSPSPVVLVAGGSALVAARSSRSITPAWSMAFQPSPSPA